MCISFHLGSAFGAIYIMVKYWSVTYTQKDRREDLNSDLEEKRGLL